MSDVFKTRRTGVKAEVQDPAEGIKSYGIHGERAADRPIETAILPQTSRRLAIVPISKIRPGRYQKRETIDPQKYQQLKDQIRELGLNFVAILASDPDDPTFYNLMMGGHIRLQVAAELGITEVSAIIREYNRTALAKGTYFENNGRQPLTLIEEGLIFKQCQEDEGWTQEEIAEKLLVPGGRSHVALCLLTVTAPPDIQEMLRQDPKRGQRCFYYLRQLDVLGEEKAIALRGPLIQDFLTGKVSTDEMQLIVKQILQREQGEAGQELSLEDARRQNRITSTVKSFRRFEKEIGQHTPNAAEREVLADLKAKIEEILKRQ